MTPQQVISYQQLQFQSMINPHNFFTLFMLFSCITFLNVTLQVNAENYVQEACSATIYQDICQKSLASYGDKAKRSPSRWARAGVSVTIGEAKRVAQYLDNLKVHNHLRGKNRGALFDCVENIEDTLDSLHKSLNVLRGLKYDRFDEQMNDILTWLSAALTNEDTCLGGFDGKVGKQISNLCNKVQNASYITSNALALANKLATTGLQSLDVDP